VLDGIGSVRANEMGQTFEYYPYGEEMGSGTANGREKFATYTREASTGLDYADQRYYTSAYGAFLSSDPMHTTATSPADPRNPGTWNRYAYVGGDPVNHIDPTGNDFCSDNPDSCGLGSWFGGAACSVYNGDPSANPYNSFCGGGSGPGWWSLSAIGAAVQAVITTVMAQVPDASHVTAPVLDCGDTLGAAGILPTSSTGIALSSVLLGENSWGLIGTQQYQNGDRYGHPTGLTITAGTVAQEDNYMLDVIANQASAHGLSQLAQAQASGVFLGYGAGAADFTSYQLNPVGSSSCEDLREVSLADDSFAAGGSVARTSYNQWRGVAQRTKSGKRFVRWQRPGDTRVGGTDFFTVQNP
jgi:RHS repeat-associated protein